MRSLLTLVFVAIAMQLGISQSENDLLSCLELAFSHPDMEQLVQEEWGESRTLYIVQRRRPNIDRLPFTQLLNQLGPEDFYGFPFPIELITEEQEEQLKQDRSQNGHLGILGVSGMFRSNRLSMNLSGALPSNFRKSIIGSFVFAQQGDNWTIEQSHVQVNP